MTPGWHLDAVLHVLGQLLAARSLHATFCQHHRQLHNVSQGHNVNRLSTSDQEHEALESCCWLYCNSQGAITGDTCCHCVAKPHIWLSNLGSLAVATCQQLPHSAAVI